MRCLALIMERTSVGQEGSTARPEKWLKVPQKETNQCWEGAWCP